jgi:hypothetical protein
MLFTAHKKAEEPKRKPMMGVDIEESFANLRNGCMTEEDEANLRDCAKFERDDRKHADYEFDLMVVEINTNLAVDRA